MELDLRFAAYVSGWNQLERLFATAGGGWGLKWRRGEREEESEVEAGVWPRRHVTPSYATRMARRAPGTHRHRWDNSHEKPTRDRHLI
ncbi:hypothetical protein BHM03_00032277 [Ensete ventricosum]|nr:hypothetical protein BHM03_00032277 [Ensete ventricosum]